MDRGAMTFTSDVSLPKDSKQPLVPSEAMHTAFYPLRIRFLEPCACVGRRWGGPSHTIQKLFAMNPSFPDGWLKWNVCESSSHPPRRWNKECVGWPIDSIQCIENACVYCRYLSQTMRVGGSYAMMDPSHPSALYKSCALLSPRTTFFTHELCALISLRLTIFTHELCAMVRRQWIIFNLLIMTIDN